MFEKDRRSCEHRGPLPELYECEPLSVRVEAVRLMKHKLHLLLRTGTQSGRRSWRGYLLCSRGVGLWSCLRCEFGEARGSGMEDTSWVWSLYQWGSSSRRAVSSSMRIFKSKHTTHVNGHRATAAQVSGPKKLSGSYLSQEFALLLSHPGLVPQRDLQHPLPELPPVHRRIHKGLVPLGL